MDLNTLKNNYAQEQGYEDFESLVIGAYSPDDISKAWAIDDFQAVMEEICIRAQKAALENAAENVKMKRKENVSELSMMDDWSEIDRTSITNPENLIR